MSAYIRIWSKWSGNGPKWSGNGPKWSGNGPRCSEMVQGGLKWYNKVQESPRLQNGQRSLKNWKKYFLYWYGLSAESAKASGKKEETLDYSPHYYSSIVFLCSFLFVRIFPYVQVGRSFKMGHSAISPSLMALFYLQKLFKTYPHRHKKNHPNLFRCATISCIHVGGQ